MKGKVWDISTLEKLDLAVKEILALVSCDAQKDNATVFALNGDLGAGKTTFTQNLARELGVIETVTSPTFVIMKKYVLAGNARFKHLVHVDAYRLEDPQELLVLNFEQDVSNQKNLVVVEWADRVRESLPKDSLFINFEIDKDNRTLQMV